MILEKENLLQRWNEYVGDRFQDENEQMAIYTDIARPDILKTELESALAELNRDKEAWVALDHCAIEMITVIINEIYDSCDIPKDLCRPIFMA